MIMYRTVRSTPDVPPVLPCLLHCFMRWVRSKDRLPFCFLSAGQSGGMRTTYDMKLAYQPAPTAVGCMLLRCRFARYEITRTLHTKSGRAERSLRCRKGSIEAKNEEKGSDPWAIDRPANRRPTSKGLIVATLLLTINVQAMVLHIAAFLPAFRRKRSRTVPFR